MRLLLAIRDKLSRFYGEYDTVIRIALKFVLALCTFCMINAGLGQAAVLNNLLVLLVLAVIGAFLPSNSLLLIGAGMILVHFYNISLEAALAGGGILIIAMLLYFSIAPHSAVPLILTAMSMPFGCPAMIAVLFGLIGGPLSAIGVIFGAAVYYLITVVGRVGGNLSATSVDAAEALVEKMTSLIDAVISNKEMFLAAGALALLLWTVYLIRRLSIRYAWAAAAAAGIMVYLAVRIGGAILLALSPDVMGLIPDVGTALVMAWLAQTFLFSLDYKRTENIRFEDDDYYYYVKAVPKRKIRRRKKVRRVERR